MPGSYRAGSTAPPPDQNGKNLSGKGCQDRLLPVGRVLDWSPLSNNLINMGLYNQFYSCRVRARPMSSWNGRYEPGLAMKVSVDLQPVPRIPSDVGNSCSWLRSLQYGIFKQLIRDGWQAERCDSGCVCNGKSPELWLVKLGDAPNLTSTRKAVIRFVGSRPNSDGYALRYTVPGYNNNTVNKLRLVPKPASSSISRYSTRATTPRCYR